jgi:hypothetical protein
MFSNQVISFIQTLSFSEKLPSGISILNPFKDNKEVLSIAENFYRKFYNDANERHLILGINPGRLGAGATGIPFTDTKRLASHCGIQLQGPQTHEPSSVFVYNVIDAYGGAETFYKKFYISSICPLGFVAHKNGKVINYNYYDDTRLMKSVRPFAIASLKKQLEFGISRNRAFCFGTGKNFKFIKALNDEFHFFEEVVPLEHPRYIMQYKSKSADQYIENYLRAFENP